MSLSPIDHKPDYMENLLEELTKEDKQYAHIINPADNHDVQHKAGRPMIASEIVLFAKVHGFEVRALCGYVFVPKRDADKLDACQICIDVAGMLMRNAGE